MCHSVADHPMSVNITLHDARIRYRTDGCVCVCVSVYEGGSGEERDRGPMTNKLIHTSDLHLCFY